MADKTYVVVANVAIKAIFDNKYKASLLKKVKDALEDAVDGSSKLTTKAPAKDADGFYLAPTASLTRTDGGVQAEVSVVLADWPKKKLFGSKGSKAEADVSNPAKIDQKVNEALD